MQHAEPMIPRLNVASQQNRSTTLKFIIVGDSGVGKTKLINELLSEESDIPLFHMKSVTNDMVHYTMETEEYGTVMLKIWDTVGEERAEYTAPNVFRGANGIIILYDITNRESFMNVTAKWLTRIRSVLGDGGLGDDTDEDTILARDNIFKILIVANKIDIYDRNRGVSMKEATALTDAYQLPFVQISAISDENDKLKLPFVLLVDLLMPFYQAPSTSRGPRVSLDTKNTDDSTACC